MVQVNYFQNIPLDTILSKKLTQQYCYVEFPFKFFDEMVNKRDFSLNDYGNHES